MTGRRDVAFLPPGELSMADPLASMSGAAPPTTRPATLRTWMSAIRLKHWTKNFFVLAPFLAGPRFGVNEYLVRALAGVLLFGLLASAVYLMNDVKDVESDRLHPKKRHRPIASGRITVASACVVAIALAVAALSAGALLDLRFFAALVAYALNNVAYAVLLKSKTVVDVMSIALGFVIRIFAGGYIVDVAVTEWLVACVFALSVLLGFGKRRGEYEELRGGARSVRIVHESYTVPKLDLLLAISAAVTIVTYMLYTMAPETSTLHGTEDLLYTTPFVAYCIYRYTLKVQEPGGGDPVEVVFRDRGFTLAGVAWILLFLWLIR